MPHTPHFTNESSRQLVRPQKFTKMSANISRVYLLNGTLANVSRMSQFGDGLDALIDQVRLRTLNVYTKKLLLSPLRWKVPEVLQLNAHQLELGPHFRKLLTEVTYVSANIHFLRNYGFEYETILGSGQFGLLSHWRSSCQLSQRNLTPSPRSPTAKNSKFKKFL